MQRRHPDKLGETTKERDIFISHEPMEFLVERRPEVEQKHNFRDRRMLKCGYYTWMVKEIELEPRN